MWDYSQKAIEELVRDYRKDFDVHLSYEDAVRMTMLVDLLSELFEKYQDEFGDDHMPTFMSPLLRDLQAGPNRVRNTSFSKLEKDGFYLCCLNGRQAFVKDVTAFYVKNAPDVRWLNESMAKIHALLANNTTVPYKKAT